MQRATRVSVLVFFATGLALMLASQPGMAQESSSRLQGFAQPKEHPVRAQLISEHTTIQPGGSTRVGIFLQMEDGWPPA